MSITGFYSLRPIVTDTLQSVEFPDKVNLGSVRNTERKMTVDAVFLSKVHFKKGNGSTLCCCKLTESPLDFVGSHTDVPKIWPFVLRAMSKYY